MRLPGKTNYDSPKRVMLHILFWLIITSYFAWGFGLNVDYKLSFLNALLYLPGFIIVSYAVLYFLIPRYLNHKKYLAFFIGFVVVLLICFLYASLAQLTIIANQAFKGMDMTSGRSFLPFIHVAAIAASIKLLEYWNVEKQRTAEATKQKVIAELALLKSQIHPHFLFNTLNNLYSLTLEASSRAPEVVLKLSSLLRFMIYDSAETTICISQEIDLLRQYISLEQLRYGDRLDISMSFEANFQGLMIAPLLLIPLVENAFKHGTSQQIDQCWIRLDFRSDESVLTFKLINSKDQYQAISLPDHKELGIKNVKRRLELLYPARHELFITEGEDMFIVDLRIETAPVQEHVI